MNYGISVILIDLFPHSAHLGCTKDKKYVSRARGCVQAINAHLPDDFNSLQHGRQDEAFRAACFHLCDALISAGHGASKDILFNKLTKNDYSSIYENDLKWLRKLNA